MSTQAFHRRYVGTNEAAKFLDTHQVTLRSARVSGLLWGRPAPEFIKARERKVLYDMNTLEEWVQSAPKMTVAGAEK